MTVHTPIPDHAAARRAMVDSQLKPQGVTDRGVLEAMGAVPREQFVGDDVRPLAYVDRGLALGNGRFIMAPAVLGQLLTEMAPRPGQRALVVGAGSGYSAAILQSIGVEVVALECDPTLAARAREAGVATVDGPLAAGHEANAPYDLILIDGAVDSLPAALVSQLADGGRLGAALADGAVTRLVVGRKVGDAFGYLSIGDAGVPALPGFQRPGIFTF